VNIIPRSLSAEANQDSEPHLTVNPSNPDEIVATAFTPDPGGSSNAPIFLSADGGRSWVLNVIVPSTAGSATHDITTGFSGTGNSLYAGILRAPSSDLELLGTADGSQPVTMQIFQSRSDADQPFTHATTVRDGPDRGRQRVYIGDNDFNANNGQTATLDQSLDVGSNNPQFASVRLERRPTSGQNGPQIRPISHPDGSVYAAFYGWRATTGSFAANTFRVTSADVVAVRDDNWGSGAAPFTALVDPGDGVAGIRVARGVSFPFMRMGTSTTGQQRLGGGLSIAVDPNNSAVVYLVYADQPRGSILTSHVCRSTDRGRTWSDVLRLDNAINGAIAVSSAGAIGLLYQELTSATGIQRWRTVMKRSRDGVNWSDVVLAEVPVTDVAKQFDPYLGDYDHLVAVGREFFGVFSTGNTPDNSHFPNGVTYQRNANFASRKLFRLDNRTEVHPSIDPFFFRIADQ
jgi:hypothetical protein